MKHLIFILLGASTNFSVAAIVSLQNATASYSQPSYLVGATIDSNINDSDGWAIDGGTAQNQIAVFEFTNPESSIGGFNITVNLVQRFFFDHYSIGRFRISVTDDDQAIFADGLASSGDTTASWTILTPDTFSASNGVTLTELGDSSVLASGALPTQTTYLFSATTGLSTITGIRLEVLTDASLPNGGPGRASITGNFVLSEMTVDTTAIPEPAAFGAALGGCVLLLGLGSRRRHLD